MEGPAAGPGGAGGGAGGAGGGGGAAGGAADPVQKALDENRALIAAALENQNLGRVAEAEGYLGLLKTNLLALAKVADQQFPRAAAAAAAAAEAAEAAEGAADGGAPPSRAQVVRSIRPTACRSSRNMAEI